MLGVETLDLEGESIVSLHLTCYGQNPWTYW